MDQSNKTRFIYTISEFRKSSEYCQLKYNKLYFSRESKSDEKIVFTERIMHSITRTVLLFAFSNLSFEDGVEDIIERGTVVYNTDVLTFETNCSILDFIHFLDNFFGENFSRIVNRALSKVYEEYVYEWQYCHYDGEVYLPSALDIVLVYRFYNMVNARLSKHTQFLVDCSVRDLRIALQSRIKRVTA